MSNFEKAAGVIARTGGVRPLLNNYAVSEPEPEPIVLEGPKHVMMFATLMQSKFPTGKDTPKWDAHDTHDYGRAVYPLTPDETLAVFSALRDRFIFRPSLPDVRKVVGEVLLETRGAGHDDLLTAPAYHVEAMTPVDVLRRAAQGDGQLLIEGKTPHNHIKDILARNRAHMKDPYPAAEPKPSRSAMDRLENEK